MTDLLFAGYRGIEAVTRRFGHAGAWIIVLLILTMDYEVLMRYAFNAPTMWAYEIGYMLMGTIFLFTIGFAMIMRSHVRVDFLYSKMSPQGRATVDLIGYLFFLLPIVAWTTYGLGNYLIDAYVIGERSGESAWNPKIWPFRVVFVVGFALFTLQTVAEIFKCILTLLGRDVPVPEKASLDHD